MNIKPVSTPKSANWGSQVLSLALVLALLVPFARLTSTPTQVARVQPVLLAMAAERPEATVGVIVQKTVKDTRVEDLVARLGGTVTQDLDIINAFAAQMTAKDAAQLANADGVRWVSLDAPVQRTETLSAASTTPTNYFLDTLSVLSIWNKGLKGQGIAVAVVDSGISPDRDFSSLKRTLTLNPYSFTPNDVYGHGTHVAGIIGGNGTDSAGKYTGIAPQVDLYSLKICDEIGMAYESDVVAALQWVYDNEKGYNIRVVNLSLNSTVEQSYHTSPLDAAAEILWFNGVVVVASAGNKVSRGGDNTINAAPANDPFIITVGASDEKGTSKPNDDIVASYSAYGTTSDGFVKPDIIAPGSNIVSVLSKASAWRILYPDRVVLDGEYFRASGTSAAAPMVTAAVALLLQDEPNLTPDQVKYRLMQTGKTIRGSSGDSRSYPYLNVYAAVNGTTTQSANTGKIASRLLWTGDRAVAWNSVSWDSVSWDSVSWDSVSWDSVSWDSVSWDSDYWGQ